MQSAHEEEARLKQSAQWERGRLARTIPPGTTEEARAIRDIDLGRENELAARSRSPAQRRRSHARYWRPRLHVDLLG